MQVTKHFLYYSTRMKLPNIKEYVLFVQLKCSRNPINIMLSMIGRKSKTDMQCWSAKQRTARFGVNNTYNLTNYMPSPGMIMDKCIVVKAQNSNMG